MRPESHPQQIMNLPMTTITARWHPPLRRLLLTASLAFLSCTSQAADPNAARYYEAALTRYEKNDMAGAIIELKNAIQLDNQMLAAQVLLGKALLSEGDPIGADVAFNEALRLGINRAEVVVPLGKAYLLQGKFDALLDRIPAAGLPQETQIEVLILRSQALAEKGNQIAAMRSLDDAQMLDAKSASVRIARAGILIRSGQIDKAMPIVDEIVAIAPNNAASWDVRAAVLHLRGDYQGALAGYTKAIQFNPKNLEPRLAMAGLLLDLGKLEEADKEISEIQRLQPREPRGVYLRALLASRRGDEATVRTSLADLTKLLDPVPIGVLSRHKQMLLLAALAHHGLGNREKAKERLITYVRSFPNEPGASKLLATYHIDAGANTTAISLLEPVQKQHPEDPKILSLLASAHMAERHYSRASALLEQAVKVSSGAAGARAEFGLALIGSGQVDGGIGQLEQAFSKSPGDPRFGIALATLHLQKNQPKKARDILETVAKRNPDNLTALNLLAVARGRSGDATGARQTYEQVLSRDSRFTAAMLNLASMDIAEGKKDAARQRLGQILKANPNELDAMIEMAFVEASSGNSPEAIRWLEKARSFPKGALRAGLLLTDLNLKTRNADRALVVAKETALKAPQNLPALSAVTRAQIALGDLQGARQTLQEMTRYANFEPQSQVSVARLQRAAGNDPGAIYSLDKALSGNPDFLPALALLAEIEIAQREYSKAEQRIRGIGQKQNGQALAMRLQGDLALARGQHASAISSYRTALAKEPSSDLVLRIHRTHLFAGETDKAVQVLENWSRTHPDDSSILRALADGYLRVANLPAARASYEKLLQRQPDNPDVLNNLAQTLLKQGDKAALGYAEKAVKLASNDAGTIDTLGWILIQQGQLDRGVSVLRDARLRAPDNPEIRYHLAYALAKTNKLSEAREELSQALNGTPRFEGLDDAKKLQRDLEKR